jgi:hypothetical protein
MPMVRHAFRSVRSGVVRPPDKRRGAPSEAPPGPAAAKQQITGSIPNLDDGRRRRLLRDLDLEPAPPCTGVCRCYGAPLGGWPA